MSVSSMTVGGKIKYKIVLLGDQSTGKTALIERFINDKFQQTYNATIGIDFLVKNIVHQNKTYRLQLWDTAGQQRFKSLIPSYLKDSNCALIVFDINSQKSLQNAAKWLQLYNMHRDNTAFSILIGNKTDLQSQSCTKQLINQTAETLKLQNFLISAKTGKGVNQLFIRVIDMINDKILNTKIVDQIQQKPQQYQDTVSPSKPPNFGNKQKRQSNKPITLTEQKQKNNSNQVQRNCC